MIPPRLQHEGRGSADLQIDRSRQLYSQVFPLCGNHNRYLLPPLPSLQEEMSETEPPGYMERRLETM